MFASILIGRGLVLLHLSYFIDWFNICMFQLISKFTNSYSIVKVLANKTTKQVCIKFYDFCWNATILISFTNIQGFHLCY